MNNKLRFPAIVMSIVISIFSISQDAFAQTQRNPVLEFCTGTWCQWCPCGDDMVLDNILPNIPNAIILAYHGAGSDPFRIFPGSNIISLLGLSGYPTGVVDRVSGIQNWNSGWTSNMNSRNSVPATVSIDIDRSYNINTREFTATVDFTALSNLNGQYSYNIILVEDGQVYGQTSNNTCSPGITYFPNYVHYWLVRDMMNGATGEEIVNGAWNQGQLISKNFSYTIPVPSLAPDFDPDSCGIVVMVYKNGSPLNSNAEIQQAEEFPLLSPNYVVVLNSSTGDLLVQNSGVGEFSAVIGNEGFLDDSYYIDVEMTSPSGWSGEFTSPNGTFPFGQQDLVAVPTGSTLTVDLSVLPNAINGAAEITIQFTSMNDPNIYVSASFRLVTLTGVPGLVIDASGEGYADVLKNGLNQAFNYDYGIVTNQALYPSVDLTNFTLICWSSGSILPVFTQDEVNALQLYLDNGGLLLINGQDIGQDIFDPSGQSQFAQSFYNDYLHASYVDDVGLAFFFRGIAGDPISDQMNFSLSSLYPRSPDQFTPYDVSATSLFTFSTYTQYNSLRADDGTNRVVYLGFGLEQIADQAVRDTLVVRSINWLMDGVVVPVELTSFTATAISNGVLLKWSTVSEINNHGFGVERSEDGVEFFTVAFVEGAGTSTESREYVFTDNIEYDGGKLFYYRLKQVDFDGKIKYSDIVEVEFDIPNDYILLQNYPNPFNPSTTISYSIPKESQVSLIIYDIMGRQVAELVNSKQSAGTYNIELDASSFASGTYFYKLTAGEFVSVKKMVLLK